MAKLKESVTFEVEGGAKLKGEITPQGAKNEALQILCAVLLTAQPVIVNNIPLIRDVLKLIDLLKHLGVKTEKLSDHSYKFEASNINLDFLYSPDFIEQGGALRGSVMIIGSFISSLWKM